MVRLIPNSKVTLIGGLGFIGTNLQKVLLGWGHDPSKIVVIDDLSNSADVKISDEVRVELGDFAKLKNLDSILRETDILVHLAADTRVQDSIENPQKNFQKNVLDTFELLESCRINNVRKFVFASTGGAILGDVAPPIDETMTPLPKSPYGASKAAVEAYLSAYFHSYGIPYLVLRFSNIFGQFSSNKKSVVSAFIKQIHDDNEVMIFGNGKQTRDFLYADDLCEGITRALIADSRGVYQLGSGVGTSILEIADLVIESFDQSVAIKFLDPLVGEVQNTYCDINKAIGDFGFSPVTPLKQAISETVKWHLSIKSE